MDGRRLGLPSLRVDAMYCALVAVSLALVVVPLADALYAPPRGVFTAAVAVLGWAVLVGFGGPIAALRPRLMLVLGPTSWRLR